MAVERSTCSSPDLHQSTSTEALSIQPSAPKRGRFSELEDSDEEVEELDELDSYLIYVFKNPLPLSKFNFYKNDTRLIIYDVNNNL